MAITLHTFLGTWFMHGLDACHARTLVEHSQHANPGTRAWTNMLH